jgi:hypothetical protein
LGRAVKKNWAGPEKLPCGQGTKKRRKIKKRRRGPGWTRPCMARPACMAHAGVGWGSDGPWPSSPPGERGHDQGGRFRQRKRQGWPGTHRRRQGQGGGVEQGRGRRGTGRSNVAASSLAPAAPPSPRYPASALERRRPASLEREGSRVRPLGRPKTEWNGGAGVGVDEEGAATFFSGR